MVLAFFAYSAGKAQNITVFDIDQLKPINEVFIIDHKFNTSATTNKLGKADISKFSKSDTLIIQHPTYKKEIISYQDLLKKNNTVYLTESAVDLGEVLVLANKRIQPKDDIPNTLTSINATEIKFSNPQTSADLLSASGEVFVQKSQLGGGSPMLRGFSANRVLLVVDGVRMNNAIFRSGNLQNVISIDPNLVELTEVIMGPGSVIYGSDALGGVMNFHTVKPKLSFQKDSIVYSANGIVRYASANNEQMIHGSGYFGGKKLGGLIGITASSFGDLKAGQNRNHGFEYLNGRSWYQSTINGVDSFKLNSDSNLQRSSGYKQINLTGKIRFQPTEKIDLILSTLYATTSDIPRYDRLIETIGNTPKYSEWFYGPQEWINSTLTADFDIKNDAWDHSTIILGYQKFKESRHDRRYQKTIRRNRFENLDAYSLNIEFDKKLNEKHTFYYGVESVFNTIKSTGYAIDVSQATTEKQDVATRYPDGGSYWLNAAGYFTWNFDINKRLKFNTGVRYTYIQMQSNFEDTSFYQFPFDQITLKTSAFNGSFIGLTYKPNTKWQIKLNTSSGFRAPNIDDLAKVFDSEPGRVIIPNEHLKPEYTYDVDLSFTRKLRDQGKLEVIGFYTYLVDAMVRSDGTFNGEDSILYDGVLSKVQTLKNTGRAHIYGATVNLAANLTKHFGVMQTFTYMDGKDLENNNPLRHVPPSFGRSSLRYKRKQITAELYCMYNAWKHRDELAPDELSKPHLYTKDGTPAWATLNLRTSWNINKYLILNGSIENILDKHYRPYSSGISAPGRNFILSLRITV